MRSSFVVGALAALIGCSKSEPPISVDDYDSELVQARCERLVRCGVFAEQATCETNQVVLVDINRQPAIDQGLVHYDGAAAKRCFDKIAEQTCDASIEEGRNPPDDCKHIFNGTVEDGAACGSDAECASSRCELDRTTCMSGTCCAGTCASSTKAEVGSACAVDDDCTAGAFCEANSHTCQQQGAANANCIDDNECQFGLACATVTFPGFCTPVNLIGGACPFERCAEIGATCDVGSHTCLPIGLLGAGCQDEGDCTVFENCDLTSHQCVALPTLGQACSGSCEGDLFCDSLNDSTCKTPKPNGEPCNTNFDCTSQFCLMGPVFDECADAPVCL